MSGVRALRSHDRQASRLGTRPPLCPPQVARVPCRVQHCRSIGSTSPGSELSMYDIPGLSTNVDFLMDLASHPEFVAGNVDTEFIPRHYDSLFPEKPLQVNLTNAYLVLITSNSPEITFFAAHLLVHCSAGLCADRQARICSCL